MLRLVFFWVIALFFSACQKEGVKPCGADVNSSAFVDVVNFQDSLQVGDELILVMDFFPQDDRGRLLVLPPDFNLHWGVSLRRNGSYSWNEVDTLYTQAVAEKGKIESLGIMGIGISCSRSGNMQQARLRFGLAKPGLYTMHFFIDRAKSSTLVSQWKKCLSYLEFQRVYVVQPKGLAPDDDSYTFYVKP